MISVQAHFERYLDIYIYTHTCRRQGSFQETCVRCIAACNRVSKETRSTVDLTSKTRYMTALLPTVGQRDLTTSSCPSHQHTTPTTPTQRCAPPRPPSHRQQPDGNVILLRRRRYLTQFGIVRAVNVVLECSVKHGDRERSHQLRSCRQGSYTSCEQVEFATSHVVCFRSPSQNLSYSLSPPKFSGGNLCGDRQNRQE